MKISDPGQTQGRKKKNYFSVKKGVQIYRILPAMGEAAERGTWFKYHEVHFGFRTPEGYMKVFESPEVRNFNTKMIEVSDAAKERNALVAAKIKEIKNELLTKPNDVRLKASLEKLQLVADKFNSEKRYYYNAMDLNGNIGLLKLRSRERAALEAARKHLEKEEGVDPVKINGAYLIFNKSGDGQQDSTVQVSGYYEAQDVGGKKMRTLKLHTIDESLFPKLETDAFNLLDLYIKPTAEEVKMMVEGGEEAVKRVFDGYDQRRKRNQATGDGAAKTSPANSMGSTPTQQMSSEPPADALDQFGSAVDDDDSVGNSSLEDTTSGGGAGEDADDFLKRMGLA